MANLGAPSPGSSSPSVARRSPAWRKTVQVAINWIVLLAIVLGVGYFLRTRAHQQATPPTDNDEPPARLSEQYADTLELAPQTVEAMRVQVAAVQPAPRTAPLKLFGWLFLEGSRYVHVQSRFTGQVVEVGETSAEGGRPARPLRPGDKVEKGEVLAKLWSKDVGEKKSDLVDAISKLYLHGNVLKRLKSLAEGAIPLARLQEAERDYAADKIEIERLKRTLRSWQIQEGELEAVHAEAERIIQESLAKDQTSANGKKPSTQHPEAIRPSEQLALDRTWAELDIVAPMAGVILEKNFTVGDIIDTTHDMFKVADLSRLGVMANAYEEDLPKLVALTPDERRWEVELLAEPGLPPRKGRFETIGNVIDTTQHTAIVKGWLDNPDGQLRVGQFITATIELPNRPGLVMVPISSLVDDGSRTYVFVVRNKERTSFTRREVHLVRRGSVMALLESHPEFASSAETQPQAIDADEVVVTSGAMEMASHYHMLETQRPAVAVETHSGAAAAESRP
jgi:cobalt-zinc-cadmium efflux system membrane fusion protein